VHTSFFTYLDYIFLIIFDINHHDEHVDLEVTRLASIWVVPGWNVRRGAWYPKAVFRDALF
jgi:hypothetical protein